MSRQIRIAFFLLILLIPVCSYAQTGRNVPGYEKEWSAIDSLSGQGLPQSAQQLTEKVLADAARKQDHPQVIKAKVYLLRLKYENAEDGLKSQAKELETYIAHSEGVEQAIWQSMAAEVYRRFYEEKRYDLYARTPLVSDTSGDIDTWSADALSDHIAQLYEASLQQRTLLQGTPVEAYRALVKEGVHTRSLRPTLYDLLAFRAIDFFMDETATPVKPVDGFQISGRLWYEPAPRFSEVRVKVKDASSFNFRALRLFQDLIAFHLKDTAPEALIDADLKRLEFVHDKSTSVDNDSLYVNALKEIAARYPQSPSTAQALFLLAKQKTDAVPGGISGRGTTKKNFVDIPAVKKELEAIATRFPGTEGAANAARMRVDISALNLSLQTEQVYIPGENIKALVRYKNTSSLSLQLYSVALKGSRTEISDDSLLTVLKKQAALRSWQQALPQSEDMLEHSTEIKIDALPSGAYVLVATAAGNESSKEQMTVLTRFGVSRLSLVEDQNAGLIYVLDRQTGRPVPDAKMFFYEYRNTKELLPGRASGKDGKVLVPSGRSARSLLVVAGTDSLRQDIYVNNYRSARDSSSFINTFFFTDRSIYRPGQTVYFKGIILRRSFDQRRNDVVAGRDTKVILRDANGQEQSALQLKSNEYGSFTGSFTLPQGSMTGIMRIESPEGSASFSVEEYRRPKFYVEFDTVRGSYRLNETVTVKGSAKAYAGNNIDGAGVKYRVVRKTRFPYYWCYYYWGMPVVPDAAIAEGTATTSTDGSFEISFETVPDASVAKESMPLFDYEVMADVTDVNGETRSGNTLLRAGYTGIQIETDLPEQATPSMLTKLDIRTENLNGTFTPSATVVSIARLESPGFLRKRLWETPDVYVMTESEFRAAFPADEYKEESNYLNWEKDKTVFEKQWTTTGQPLAVPETTWSANGWYVVEIKVKDAGGSDVTEKKYVHVWSPDRKDDGQQALAVHTEKEAYEPGEELKLWLTTAVPQPYLLKSSTADYKQQQPIRITVKEEDRGGILFAWLYVWNNRVYRENKTVSVPWSNKELQLEWATHRDKLQPGAPEQWTLTIKGPKKEKVAAELLAGMYDASLDAFRPHSWKMSSLFPVRYELVSWNADQGFGSMYSVLVRHQEVDFPQTYEKEYDDLLPVAEEVQRLYFARDASAAPGASANVRIRGARTVMMKGAEVASQVSPSPAEVDKFTPPSDDAVKTDDPKAMSVRRNLQETAFFFPQLKTDTSGSVSFSFTLPEALTEWKMMSFAHTKDWKTGYLDGKVKTQKDLMVMPNLPRFLRQGDNIRISTKISNLSAKELAGSAILELLDAATLQPLPISKFMQREWSDGEQASKSFSVQNGQSTVVNWKLHVPESMYTPVVVRITARSGNFSDGEENTLPVVTNRTLVTETLPLTVKGSDSKDFTLDKLVQNNSNTLVNRGLTVEFTGNPAWYAVQALPYLMEYPYECAEQTFNRLYADALAGHIVSQSPKVEEVFRQWQQKDTAALLSALQKNENLKLSLLEETPWVMEAQDEQEQKKRIALLFQASQLASQYGQALQQLQRMQLPDGSFPWFAGMNADRFITQYILTGLGRLQQLGIKAAARKGQEQISTAALNYADGVIAKEYDALLKTKANLKEQQIGNMEAQYLYMRSFFAGRPVKKEQAQAYQYYRSQAARFWPKFNPYLKAQLALALYRSGDAVTAKQIMASLKETAIQNENMGMYWKDMPRGYSWSEAPIEAQSVLIEAFAEVEKDNAAVDAMKLWLLRQKQAQHWNTTKATADACYALLLTGSNWIAATPDVRIRLGQQTIAANGEAGTGYFQKQFKGNEVSNDMGHINVTVKAGTSGQSPVSWGAVYWQYFEDMDKVAASETGPLSLKRTLYIEKNSPTGPVLTEIREGNPLKVGDKVKVRIEVRADRDMEYVQLKDSRASCFEPQDVLSQYKYQNGTGYFQSTRDLATHFFFDHLRKGTYVFEYALWVNAAGNFNNGISSIQCMYAPEFAGHSNGIRVDVE